MCIDPQSTVWVKRGPKWIKVPKPCGDCWQCKENFVNDWVGRCLCEAATSQISVTLSLTYATPENKWDFSHRVINPYHFQLFMKRLRKAGHKVRYLVAGEYGELRDRAHFHCILFFKKLKDGKASAPKLENRQAFAADHTIAQPLSRQMPQKDMCHIREWPHGHVVADWSCSEKSVRYCCEYLYQNGKKNCWFSMSKKPALGFDWFAQKAARNVELSVMPSTFEYLPPGGTPGKVYLMTGATRRDYLNLIVRDRAKRPQMSKWVRATFDKLERQEFVNSRDGAHFDDEAFRERQRPLDKVRSSLLIQEARDKIAAEHFAKALAAEWGFDDVEEFESFAAAGGCETHPHYFRGGPLNIPGSQGNRRSAHVDARPASGSAKRPPTGYDRQGRPYWGEPGRDYLGSAFARPEAGSRDADPQDRGMQEGPAEG